MAVTVGLINELRFISKRLGTPIESTLKLDQIKQELRINIKDDKLTLFYLDNHIWTESLEEDISMFGVESCDNIAKIITLIDMGDGLSWRELAYHETD